MPEKKEVKARTTNLDSFNKFIDEFSKESDRAAVVLGAAKLDLLLYQVLHLYLKPPPSSSDELLDGDSPLGTFSSKIHMAYRLGLIDAGLSRALHMIRKIRNSFAHEVDGCSLESGAHRDRIRELVAPFRSYASFDSLEETCCRQWDMSGARLEFRIVLGTLAARLEGLFQAGHKVEDRTSTTLIPEVWKQRTK